jgi:hypothetical protein
MVPPQRQQSRQATWKWITDGFALSPYDAGLGAQAFSGYRTEGCSPKSDPVSIRPRFGRPVRSISCTPQLSISKAHLHAANKFKTTNAAPSSMPPRFGEPVTASRRRFCLPKSLIMAQGLPHGLEPRERGGRVVLNNLNEQIRECLQHAEDCALKAAAQTDPKLVSRRRHF